jgi:selenide,water dikinase
MGADALAHVLRPLAELFPRSAYPDLIVGLDGPDDAAVYRLAEDDAIVVTTDFFPPVVDDPFEFGAIAAANAMGDVFAMGGRVLLALNLAAFPEDLGHDVTAAIVRGAAEAVREAGGVVAGGHTIIDVEPKFGLAVVGRVDPRRMLTKTGARPGDRLVLTKPIGTGLITTALKRGAADAADVSAAVAMMRRLNRRASELAVEHGVRAATDVTGFGVAGHGLEMAAAEVRFRLELESLPVLPGALKALAAGHVPGGTSRNRQAFGGRVEAPSGLTHDELLFDPQTSGGLLMAVAPQRVDALVRSLRQAGEDAWVIGSVEEGAGMVVTAV